MGACVGAMVFYRALIFHIADNPAQIHRQFGKYSVPDIFHNQLYKIPAAHNLDTPFILTDANLLPLRILQSFLKLAIGYRASQPLLHFLFLYSVCIHVVHPPKY